MARAHATGLQACEPEHQRNCVRKLTIGKAAAARRIPPGRAVGTEEGRLPLLQALVSREHAPRHRDEGAEDTLDRSDGGARADQIPQFADMRHVLIGIADEEMHTAPAGAFYEIPGFAGVEGQRLLAKYVRA